jgi:hypothetical protein
VNASELRGLLRIAGRRTLTRGTCAALAAALLLGVLRARTAAAELPEAAAANAALVLWLVWAALLVPLGCAWLGARGGAQLQRDAPWCARWPRRPFLSCTVLGLGGALAATAAVCLGTGAATLGLARSSRLDAVLVRALPGPELLLAPGAAAERWRLEDPRAELGAGRELCFEIDSIAVQGGPAAEVALRVRRANDGGATEAEPSDTRLVVGSARLHVPLPPGAGALDFELLHSGGRAWLHLAADAGVLVEPRAATAHALGAWTARLAAAGMCAAGLAFGCARWMRRGYAVSLALLPFALQACGAKLPSLWPLADWDRCLALAAAGIAAPLPSALALGGAAALALLGIASAAPRGGRA